MQPGIFVFIYDCKTAGRSRSPCIYSLNISCLIDNIDRCSSLLLPTYCNIRDLIVLILLFFCCITLSCHILLVLQLSKRVNFSNHFCHCYNLKPVVKPTIITTIIILVRLSCIHCISDAHRTFYLKRHWIALVGVKF